MNQHTASDFIGAQNPTALGLDCQRLAAKLAMDHRYQEAIREYLVSIVHLRSSTAPDAAQHIAFAESEVARLSACIGEAE